VVVTPNYPKDGFCDEGGVSWAWCEDFDGQGMSARAQFIPANSDIQFRSQSHGRMNGTECETSGDCTPYVQGGSLFLNAEDVGFGMNILRVEKPFSFANGREGRIHYRSNLKGGSRHNQTIHITPTITSTMPDTRDYEPAGNMSPAISIVFAGDGGWPFAVLTWKNGHVDQIQYSNGPHGITPGTLYDVDIYVLPTRIRIALDGKQIASIPLQNIGFDTGYVMFTQNAYNPPKDGNSGDAANRFLWDNLAFDGPSLAPNSLTPANKQDVLFRTWGKATCSVRGQPADGPPDTTAFNGFDTWHVQFDASAPPVTLDEISCTLAVTVGPPKGGATIGDIQTIKLRQ
jgi:hypothetical protein